MDILTNSFGEEHWQTLDGSDVYHDNDGLFDCTLKNVRKIFDSEITAQIRVDVFFDRMMTIHWFRIECKYL